MTDERMWKEMIMACFKAQSHHHEVIEKNYETPQSVNQCPSRDSNGTSPE
jgi:hypothetical protein